MKKSWDFSQEEFDALLDWLDADREKAGIKYEQIRQRLIKFFQGRACPVAEDLADESINRVASRVNEIQKDFTGDRLRYFYGVANKVWMEYLRQPPPPAPPPAVDTDRVEQEYRCLEKCIQRLRSEHRELLIKYYYPQEGQSLIEQRRLLAEKLQIAPNALRIRAFRIRAALQKCVEKCLEQ